VGNSIRAKIEEEKKSCLLSSSSFLEERKGIQVHRERENGEDTTKRRVML
jgi:hypothetical protein